MSRIYSCLTRIHYLYNNLPNSGGQHRAEIAVTVSYFLNSDWKVQYCTVLLSEFRLAMYATIIGMF